MHSVSSISFMRTQTSVPALNLAGADIKVTPWHATVPGYGGDAPWPGLACGTKLEGTLQRETYAGIEMRPEDPIHDECRKLVEKYINADGGTFSLRPGSPTPRQKVATQRKTETRVRRTRVEPNVSADQIPDAAIDRTEGQQTALDRDLVTETSAERVADSDSDVEPAQTRAGVMSSSGVLSSGDIAPLLGQNEPVAGENA